jgi:predicted signal transduction protein with EAL and GGDEF domain
VARLGGDEFVILASGLDSHQARGMAGRVQRLLAQPIADATTGGEHRITVSVGVAFDDGRASADDLIRHADAAMFTAKSSGTGVALYEADSRETATQELELHSALRSALELGQLHIVYQPVVDLASGEVASAEALIRWTHPTLGSVSPADFVPVAERHGLIADIGDWVLRTAGLEALDWNELSGRPVPVAVNVSPRQLTDPHFADRVTEILGAIRLSPPLLTLEITETALVHDDAVTRRNLDALAALGVRIALDDFGTGYSSLSHLRHLPISTIKIDRTFVDGLGIDRDDTAIVTGVIGMARGLTLETVAEGVETDAQVQALARLDCDYGQGYRYARPLPAADFVAMLVRSAR